MNNEQLLRYSRQIMLPQLGIEGQQALMNSKVLIAGIGGLGSPVALYLTAAGVGHLTLVDKDAVDLSNLQRQIIHPSKAINQRKVQSAQTTLNALNPETKLQLVDKEPSKSEWLNLIDAVDLVVDATDNFTSRYMLNRICALTSTPLVSGAAIRFEGQVTVFDFRNKNSPCYRCIYPQFDTENADEEGQTCSENGVLSALVGVIGSLQACEAIKLLTHTGQTLISKLLLIDILNAEWRVVKYKQDPACPVCSQTD